MKKVRFSIFLLIKLCLINLAYSSNQKSTNDISDLIEISKKTYRQHPDSAHNLCAIIKRRAKKENDLSSLAEGYLIEANTFRIVEKNYERALSNYYNAVSFFSETKDKKGLAKSLTGIAFCHFDSYNYKIALENFHEALPYRIALNETKKVSECYYNIGLSLGHLEQYDSAISYFHKSAAIEKNLNLQKNLSISYLELGLCYYEKGDEKKAILFYNKAMAIAKKLNDHYNIALILQNLGYISMKAGMLNKAQNYFETAISFDEFANDQASLINTYKNLGELHHLKKEFNVSLDYYKQAATLNPSKTNPFILADIYQYLAKHYESHNAHKEASEYSFAYISLTSPLLKKHEEHRKRHEAYKAERIDLLYENETIVAQNNTYLDYIKWLTFLAVAIAFLLLVVLHFFKKLHEAKKTQGRVMEYLKDRDRFLHALQNQLKVNIGDLARTIERQYSVMPFKHIT